MRYRRSAGFVLALLLTAGCDVKVGQGGSFSVDIAEGKATEEWSRRYSIAQGGTLEIVNVNGAIQVSSSDDAEVEVTAVREAKAGSDDEARAVLQKLEMVDEVSPARVKVEARGDWNQGARGFGHGQLTVRYTVKVPPGLSVQFHTQNGGVTLDNVRGTIVATTTNGGVTGKRLAGAVEASTVNGGVEMTLTAVAGDVSLKSVNGGVRLEIPRDTRAALSARAINGGVRVDDALPLAATEQDRRAVAGTLNGGGPRISAETTNGGVRITASGS